MKLLIIGHTAHYMKDGQIIGWGPTVKEVDWLARAFDTVTHLACFHSGEAPTSALPYESKQVQFVGLPPAGGTTLRLKIRALTLAPRYLLSIQKLANHADIIHIRTPGILGMYGVNWVSIYTKKPHWTKYAGNWVETGSMPISFRFQRFWLERGLSRGPVTINGHWPGQPEFIFSFLNPSLSIPEVLQARKEVTFKQLAHPIRFVFAGRLEKNKRPLAAIEIAKCLHEKTPIRLDILGDGPEMYLCQDSIQKYNLGNQVFLHGWVTHDDIKKFLRQAHFILHPSFSEGWPKILSEGMAYGAVPVASEISAIPQILDEFQCGISVPPLVIPEFVRRILEITNSPGYWTTLSEAGQLAAPRFTYEKYLIELNYMFDQYYRFTPMNKDLIQSLHDQYQATIG
jgi:glycosyltransferase involved in cell wall biosynthesis